MLFRSEDAQVALLIPALTSAIGLAIGFATTTPETAGIELGAGGSLVRYAEGRWTMGMPLPIPTVDSRRRDRPSLGLRLGLVQARW